MDKLRKQVMNLIRDDIKKHRKGAQIKNITIIVEEKDIGQYVIPVYSTPVLIPEYKCHKCYRLEKEPIEWVLKLLKEQIEIEVDTVLNNLEYYKKEFGNKLSEEVAKQSFYQIWRKHHKSCWESKDECSFCIFDESIDLTEI